MQLPTDTFGQLLPTTKVIPYRSHQTRQCEPPWSPMDQNFEPHITTSIKSTAMLHHQRHFTTTTAAISITRRISTQKS